MLECSVAEAGCARIPFVIHHSGDAVFWHRYMKKTIFLKQIFSILIRAL